MKILTCFGRAPRWLRPVAMAGSGAAMLLLSGCVYSPGYYPASYDGGYYYANGYYAGGYYGGYYPQPYPYPYPYYARYSYRDWDDRPSPYERK